MKTIFIFLVLGTLFSCSQYKQRLYVYNEYINKQSLASAQMKTPDPKLYRPLIGQRLWVFWDLEETSYAKGENFLLLHLLFKNRQRESLSIAINKPEDYFTYTLENKDFTDKQGILAYKAKITYEGNPIEEYNHKLWVDQIFLDEDE